MNYLDKLVVDYCYIVVVFLEGGCHVSLTTRGEKHIATLKRAFGKVGINVYDTFIFPIGYLNYWDRVHDKYAWRYMMLLSGHRIINQDGKEFEDVYEQTWQNVRATGDRLRHYYATGPIRRILGEEKRRRSVRFLPLHACRKAVDAAELGKRKFSEFERKLMHREYVCGDDVMRKEKIKVAKIRPVKRKKVTSPDAFLF